MLWKVLAVIAGFVAVGVWLTPLRVVIDLANLEASGLQTGAVHGSIWNGRIDDLTLRGANMGDFTVAADPLSLVTGAPKLSFRSNGPILEGAVTSKASGAAFANLRGQLALTQLDPQAPSGAVLTFFDTNLDLASNTCRTASGQARVVGMAAAGLPDMSGPISCETGRLRLALKPDGDQPGAAIDFLLDISNPERPRLLARTEDTAAQMALPSYGVEIIAP